VSTVQGPFCLAVADYEDAGSGHDVCGLLVKVRSPSVPALAVCWGLTLD